jgi:hypothetical protein
MMPTAMGVRKRTGSLHACERNNGQRDGERAAKSESEWSTSHVRGLKLPRLWWTPLEALVPGTGAKRIKHLMGVSVAYGQLPPRFATRPSVLAAH